MDSASFRDSTDSALSSKKKKDNYIFVSGLELLGGRGPP